MEIFRRFIDFGDHGEAENDTDFHERELPPAIKTNLAFMKSLQKTLLEMEEELRGLKSDDD